MQRQRKGPILQFSLLFLYNPADKPTNQPTNGHGWKHNFYCGGKKITCVIYYEIY